MSIPNRSTSTGSEYLTPREVYSEFGISRTTLRRLEAQGYVTPAKLPSGHRRWKRADLEQMLNGGDAA